MERALVKLLNKRWLVANGPFMAVYTFRRIIEDLQKYASEEFTNFNLFPKLKVIRKSRSCPYFITT